MKITLILIGKTDESYIADGFKRYMDRIKHYIGVDLIIIPSIKDASNLSAKQIKDREGSLLLKNIPTGSTIVLLDENGHELRSIGFAAQLQKWMNAGIKDICFVTGGAFGISDELKAIASYQLSLSKMTFTHQLVRLIFAEQLYRAFTIIRKEPYHNE
jgi:23S rRNA (pseudouridine1915-N3)-methyltransferase